MNGGDKSVVFEFKQCHILLLSAFGRNSYPDLGRQANQRAREET